MSLLRGLRSAPFPDGIDPADWTSWQWQMQHDEAELMQQQEESPAASEDLSMQVD